MNAGAPTHDVTARRHVGRVVLGSRAHTEALENPAVRGPRQ
jgi:hypothetical protein